MTLYPKKCLHYHNKTGFKLQLTSQKKINQIGFQFQFMIKVAFTIIWRITWDLRPTEEQMIAIISDRSPLNQTFLNSLETIVCKLYQL